MDAPSLGWQYVIPEEGPYRNSIEILSKFYRNSIGILSKFYRNSIGILSTFLVSCSDLRSFQMGPAECAERSAALAVGMARRVGSKAKVQIANLNLQITNPPHISPQRTCAFRPATQNRPSSWFCDFAKTIASAEQEAIKLFSTDHDTNMHQKCKLQTASFMLFMFQLTFCITFFQKCCSCSSGGHIFAKRLQVILIKQCTFLTPKRPR